MKTSENLMVFPINRESIQNKILELNPNTPSNVKYELMGREAIVCDLNLIVDNECCYSILSKKLLNNNIEYTYSFPVHIKKETDTGYSISMFPSFEVEFTLTELLTGYILPQLSLKEFMASRYEYNPRIKHNTRDFLEFINSTL